MWKLFSIAGIGLAILFAGPTVHRALAKRSPPTPVKPVSHDGVTYKAYHKILGKTKQGKQGFLAYVEAWDENTKKKLWRLKVYEIVYDLNLETDVQDVYIKTLAIDKGSLLVTDEGGKRFMVDLKTRQVSEVKDKP